MKKPDSKTTDKSSATTRDKTAEGRKSPAVEGATIDSSPVQPGAAGVTPTGGTVRPADSALLGAEKAPLAAAAKKAGAPAGDAAGDSPPTALVLLAQDRVDPADKPAETAKGDGPDADPVPLAKPAPQTQTQTPDPAAAAEIRKTGFWPVALGGVVAAGLGAAVALWAFPQGLQPAPAFDAAGLKQQILDEIDASRASFAEELAQQASIAGADAAREALADLPPPGDGGDISAMQAALDGQAGQIAALTDKLAALETAGAAGGGAGADTAALQAQLAEMQGQLQKTAADAQAQLDAVRAQTEDLQKAAASSVQRAEAMAAIATLQGALDQGGPIDKGVEQLEAAGVAAPEALTHEVPTLQALHDVFPAAARSALRAVLRDDSASSNDGGTIIGNFLRAQTGARSVEPREGDDADAILSRAGAALQNGDLTTVLTELHALPQIAREAPEMADWIAGAKANADAHAALNDLAGNTPAGPSN